MTPKPTVTAAPIRTGSLIGGALLAAGLTLLGGCTSEPKREAPQPMPPTSARQIPQPVASIPVEAPKPTYRGPWENPASPLYKRTIYFDYNSVEIPPDYISVMRTHAAYLGQNAGRRVTLEGHTDERGTREFNLALADQRADAVRRFMIAEGVTPDQMATLSYGEERPASSGHGESSWRQNRRVVIQY